MTIVWITYFTYFLTVITIEIRVFLKYPFKLWVYIFKNIFFSLFLYIYIAWNANVYLFIWQVFKAFSLPKKKSLNTYYYFWVLEPINVIIYVILNERVLVERPRLFQWVNISRKAAHQISLSHSLGWNQNLSISSTACVSIHIHIHSSGLYVFFTTFFYNLFGFLEIRPFRGLKCLFVFFFYSLVNDDYNL